MRVYKLVSSFILLAIVWALSFPAIAEHSFEDKFIHLCVNRDTSAKSTKLKTAECRCMARNFKLAAEEGDLEKFVKMYEAEPSEKFKKQNESLVSFDYHLAKICVENTNYTIEVQAD